MLGRYVPGHCLPFTFSPGLLLVISSRMRHCIEFFIDTVVHQIECSSGAIKTAYDIQIDGKRGPGRPKMSWKTSTERDCREWNLIEVDPCEKDVWRSSVRCTWKGAH